MSLFQYFSHYRWIKEKHKYFLETWQRFMGMLLTSKIRVKKLNSFKQEVHKYFQEGKHSPTYEMYVNYALNTNKRGEVIADLISKYIKLKGKSFLDVGTAYGGYLVAFAKRGCFPCKGVDIDKDFIRLGKLNLKGNNLNPDAMIRMDISYALPDFFKENKFDIITCADVIEHVHDVKKSIKNIKSLMKDKGCLLLEIPNRYQIDNVISDPHFGLFGITLLDGSEAVEYFTSLRPGRYKVNDFYELDYYLSFFPEEHYKINKIWDEDIDFTEFDRAFHNEIATAYPSKIDSLAISVRLKNALKAKFDEYITKYNSQIVKRNIDYFYIQTWRILIFNQ
jgi:2-polyprenyl-3-methyl-5-hydroxy-6-metoxy-1,4-benzoquinol methylase